MLKPDAVPPKIRRQALAALSRERLSSLTEHFELEVEDRRVLDHHVDALVRARAVDFGEVLGMLKREELQGICDTLELDRSGKEKDVLVARILGRGDAAPAAKVRPKNGPATAAVELPATGKLTVDQLERYLWSAADILRGSIDSSDYKGFIFGLLFLKRLSDVFEEEAEKLIAAGESEKVAWNDEDQHQFFVPTRARWSELQKVPTGIGEALNKACAALEEKNESLEGLLAQIDYNDERRLGDAKNRDTVLSKLVLHFSKVNLRNSSLAEPDMLGRAYEYLIEKFADDAGKKGGEFYTPRKVVQLIVELLAPKEGMRICDPTCGSGGMLIECAHYVRAHGGNAKNLTYHGQEKNLGTWAIAKMNLLLHGLTDARIEKGDTIRDPKLVKDGGLILYDRVVANPPFSLDEWGIEVAEHDGFGRFRYGLPPESKGDLAFVQHMVATLNVSGRLGVVMPHGVLFRGGSEERIRQGLVKDDLVEAVIALPPNLFYGTTIPAVILILNRAKRRSRKVLFIDASRGFREDSAQNFLRDEDIAKAVASFNGFEDVDGYAKVVSVAEIERCAFDLNVGTYLVVAKSRATVDVDQAASKLRGLDGDRAAVEARMTAFLTRLSGGGPPPAPWKTCRLGDVGEWSSGGTPSKSNENYWNGDLPWASPKDMKKLRLRDTEDHVSAEAVGNGTRLVPAGTIFVVVRGMILAHSFPVAITERPMTFNQDMKALRVADSFDPEFLLYWLVAARDQVLALVADSSHGTKRLPMDGFLDLSVPVPPRAEQRAIAEGLRAIDLALELEQRRAAAILEVREAALLALMRRRIQVARDGGVAA